MLTRRFAGGRGHSRRGDAAPILAGAVCCALLIGGALFLAARRAPSPAAGPAVTSSPVLAIERAPVQATPKAEAPLFAAPAVAAEQPREVSVGETVDGHLAAGEFGPALDAALTADDARERTQLIRRVITAQLRAGEFDAAMVAARRIPDADERIAERSRSAQEAALGGGLGADFDSLIQLIQDETSGPWFDIDGVGGTITEYENGVRVDPHGILSRVSEKDLTGRLAALGARARTADLNEDLARPATLRMVSLTRLEREVARRMADGQPVVESMRQLAGLGQIQYVFVYPDEGEVVIAGPAEGWRYNEYGMPVGAESGRPTLQLDDLVTVLRTFGQGGQQVFGCSIDPRAENMKAVKELAEASQARGPLSPGRVRGWTEELKDALGMQDVRIFGVPADSRVARVILDADYRMKLIGIGKMDGGTHVPDYFALLAKNHKDAAASLDGLRWWLTMKYESVQHSADHNAFEIRGSSVLCQSENQFVNQHGQAVSSGKTEATNRLFAANFTQHYDELARREPVFADLQGIFDLALVAAMIRHDGIDARLGWDGGVFAVNGAYRPASYHVPREVETVVNHRVLNGRDIVVQVAGGVRGDMMSVLTNPELRQESPRLAGVATENRASNLPAGRWWWDAK